MKRIRQFFWVSTGLGLLSMFTNFTPVNLKEKTSDLLVHGPGNIQKTAAEIAPVVVDENAVPEPNEPGGAKSDQPLLSATGKSMMWKARRYVLIHNKWVLERADHVYMIDGMRTYFRDSARIEVRRVAKQGATPENGDSAPSPRRGGTSKAQALLQKISSNPLSAYSPETLKELGDALSDAKASITQRDKILEDLAK